MNPSADAFVIAIYILALVGALALRIAFEVWQYRRHTKEILTRFGRRGAIDATSACYLDEIGLSHPSWHMPLRNHRAETLRALLWNGFIKTTEDGKYFLSPEAYDYYTQQGNT